MKKITLKYLRTKWSEERIEQIKNGGVLYIGSSRVLNVLGYCDLLDAVWGKGFEFLLKKRNSNELRKHIFVSKMCNRAVAEYATVCSLLNVRIINLVGSKNFFNESRKLLSNIPGVHLFWLNR